MNLELLDLRCHMNLRPAGLLTPSRMTHAEVLDLLRAGLQVGGGAGPIDTVEAAILNHAVGKATWTPPSSYWIGLSTTTPTDTGSNFTEPVGASYARINIVTADWNSASGTAPTVVTNASVMTFAAATGSWGTITYAGLFSASSGGSPQWFGATGSQTVASGNTCRFPASYLVLQLGEPTDTYS